MHRRRWWLLKRRYNSCKAKGTFRLSMSVVDVSFSVMTRKFIDPWAQLLFLYTGGDLQGARPRYMARKHSTCPTSLKTSTVKPLVKTLRSKLPVVWVGLLSPRPTRVG